MLFLKISFFANFYVTRIGCDENSSMQSWPSWLRLETTSFWQCGSKHMHATLKYFLIDLIINMLTWCNRCIFALRIQAQPLCKCARPWTLANEWIQASFTRSLKTNNVVLMDAMLLLLKSYDRKKVKSPAYLTIIHVDRCWFAKP